MSTSFNYTVYGLCISIPHASRVLPAAREGTTVDVHIDYDTVPAPPDDIVFERYNPLLQAHIAIDDAGGVWWTTSHARFQIVGGNRVTIEPVDPAVTQPAAIVKLILSCCLPAVLVQRGSLALHANAVATPGGAVVIAGVSGAGKSTLLGALVSRGFPMLSDDVAALNWTPNGVQVAPGFPVYRLCGDALEKLAARQATAFSLGGVRGKSSASAPLIAFESQATYLKAIYVLSTSDSNAVTIDSLQGPGKLAALRSATYMPLCPAYFPKQMEMLGRFASSAPMYDVRRPRSLWTVDELIELISNDPSQARQHVA